MLIEENHMCIGRYSSVPTFTAYKSKTTNIVFKESEAPYKHITAVEAISRSNFEVATPFPISFLVLLVSQNLSSSLLFVTVIHQKSNFFFLPFSLLFSFQFWFCLMKTIQQNASSSIHMIRYKFGFDFDLIFDNWDRTEYKMKLTPREVDKLGLHNAGFLAQKRLARGRRLNYTEAVGLIATQVSIPFYSLHF